MSTPQTEKLKESFRALTLAIVKKAIPAIENLTDTLITIRELTDDEKNAEYQALIDVLSLVGEDKSLSEVKSWSKKQVDLVWKWAGAVYAEASDNDVEIPERPKFL